MMIKNNFMPAPLSDANRALCDGIAAFCARHNISVRAFSAMVSRSGGRLSPTGAHRVLSGRCGTQQIETLYPFVLDAFTNFLTDRQLTADQISDELYTIANKEILSMLTSRCKLSDEAVRFFGLTTDPFDVDHIPYAEEIFTNAELDSVAAKVVDAAVYQRFVAVIGHVGSGKTLLKLRVAEEVEDRAILVYPEFFDMAEVSVHGIANKLLVELGQKVPRAKEERVTKIKQVLIHLAQEGKPVAIVMDECHRLNSKVLSSLKNFWEMTNG